MASNEYNSVLDAALLKLTELIKQQEDTEIEISKTRQFIYATLNMLSDDDRSAFWHNLRQHNATQESMADNLSDAVREVLSTSPKVWFTVTEVRDALRTTAFDFSKYTSNPLASISTTLRRMVPKEVDMATPEGVSAFRWKNTKTNRRRQAERNMRALYKSVFGDNADFTGSIPGFNDAQSYAEALQEGSQEQPELPEPPVDDEKI
jgi:hypothetical protein